MGFPCSDFGQPHSDAEQSAYTIGTRRSLRRLHHHIPACPWTIGIAGLLFLLNLGLVTGADSGGYWLEYFQYDRAAVAKGQFWRLFSSNLVHWSPGHLLLDLSVFLVLGCWCELAYKRAFLSLLTVLFLAVGIAIDLALPQLPFYRGLSGVDSGLFAAVLWWQWKMAAAPLGRLCLLPAAVIFVAKLAHEMGTGELFFSTESLGYLGVPVPLSHLVGAASGFGFGVGLSIWSNTVRHIDGRRAAAKALSG